MKDEFEQRIEVYQAMRSMYRLAELKSMNSPETLIEMEKSLLSKYLRTLTPDESLYLATSFNAFCDEQRADDALSTEEFFLESNKYFSSLN